MPTLTRSALYDIVCADPVRMVAATFGVSDVWLKKVCAGANLPAPQRGYWAKLQAGKGIAPRNQMQIAQLRITVR